MVKPKDDDENNYFETRVFINRPVFNKKKFDDNYKQTSEYPTFKLKNNVTKVIKNYFTCDKAKIKKQVYNRIPAIKWLRSYNFREFLVKDFAAGLTVGTMHIPYGILIIHYNYEILKIFL
jgi:hypothetical protein